MKRIITLSLLALLCLQGVAQEVNLAFTGRDADNLYVELNRVVVTNHSKGWNETLFWPDTTLTMQDVTSEENGGLLLSQNNPNPFKGSTQVRLAVKEAGEVTVTIANTKGRVATTYASMLQSGIHQYRVNLAQRGTYLMTASWNGKTSSVKMICEGEGGTDRVDYQGFVEPFPLCDNDLLTHPFCIGDKMEYIGYAFVEGTEKAVQLKARAEEASQTVTLQFANNDEYDDNDDDDDTPLVTVDDFRVALSLSPFSLNQFKDGYSFVVGDQTATTPEELQSIYRDLGSTEMYVRLATKRHITYNADGTLDNTTDGKPDENANVHTFDQVIQTCRIAAHLDIPINPEVMCAYIYMDMDGTQAPRFYEEDYPELYAKPEFYSIMHDKKWEELSLEDICTVLEMYGEFVADSILATGCTVNDWNLGNEANFGFAGIGIGTPNSFDQKLAKAGEMKRYMSSLFGLRWLKEHVWKYEAQTLAAVKRGILKAYKHYPELDASKVKFSTHIATVTSTPRATAAFFTYMAEHGYAVETAGISYYPSAPAMSFNKKAMLTKTVTRINKKCGVPVFIGEFSYPSQEMVGPFAGWNKQLKGYEKDQQGQADIYKDVIAWGKDHGLAGIRYWAPDYKGEWYPMSMFEFSNKVGTAKTILKNHKEIVEN